MTDYAATIVAGDNLILQITARDENGAIFPLTNVTELTFTAKGDDVNIDGIINKSLSDGVTITDASNGVYQVALETADTLGMDNGLLYFEAKATDSVTGVHTIRGENGELGELTVSASINQG